MAENGKKRNAPAAVGGTGAKNGNTKGAGGSAGKTGRKSAKDSREQYRKGISYTFSFILSLFMLLGTVCLVALTSLFSESFFFDVIEDSYYEAVLSEIVTSAEDYTIPAELDISVLDGVFTVNNVKHDVNGHVTAAFRGYHYTPDMQSENSRLYANVSAYLAENNIKIEDSENSVISSYIKEIDDIYLDKVTLPGIDLIKVARQKVKGVVTGALILLFAFSLTLLVVLIRLYRHPHKGVRYVAYASGGCTLMCFALPFGLCLSQVYAHVQVAPEYFYNFVSSYLKHILFSFMQASLIWLIITIGCAVFVYLSKNGLLEGRLKKKMRRKLRSLQARH